MQNILFLMITYRFDIKSKQLQIHDIQRRKNPHLIYRDRVSWVAKNQEPKKLRFLKIPNFFCIIFDENSIVKLGIDHAVCEDIAATEG